MTEFDKFRNFKAIAFPELRIPHYMIPILRETLNHPERKILVAHHGRLHGKKTVSYLLEQFKQFRKENVS